MMSPWQRCDVDNDEMTSWCVTEAALGSHWFPRRPRARVHCAARRCRDVQRDDRGLLHHLEGALARLRRVLLQLASSAGTAGPAV